MAGTSLAGLNVLLTRPAGRAKELSQRITAAGGKVLHVPLLSIEPLDPARQGELIAQAKQHVLDLDNYHSLIFISANAVDYGMSLVEQYWPQLPAQQNYYAIGAATAKALAHYGINATTGGGSMTSESLLAEPTLQNLSHQRIAIFRGLGGRETLAQTLRERGANVDYIECYQRQIPDIDQNSFLQEFDSHEVNCTVINSGETLQQLDRLLPAAHRAYQQPLVVPSERVAELARNMGFGRALAADNAGSDATLAALLTLATPLPL